MEIEIPVNKSRYNGQFSDRTNAPARHSASKRCDSTPLGVGVVDASVHILGVGTWKGCASVLNTTRQER